ncbi:MAG: outer membrane beta-barrel protein, partial [Devosia sp.]
TGRLGLAFDQTLLYAKGGVALYGGQAMQATTKTSYTPTGTGAFVGWALGAGIEQFISSNVSLKAEYEHLGFGSQLGYQTNVSDVSTPIGYKFNNWTEFGIDTVKVGIDYHIN